MFEYVEVNPILIYCNVVGTVCAHAFYSYLHYACEYVVVLCHFMSRYKLKVRPTLIHRVITYTLIKNVNVQFWTHEQPFHHAAVLKAGHTYSHLKGIVSHTLSREFWLLPRTVCAVPTFPPPFALLFSFSQGKQANLLKLCLHTLTALTLLFSFFLQYSKLLISDVHTERSCRVKIIQADL